MREVAIIGAGELGGLVAYTVARADTVASIKLIDSDTNIARGKALDIRQAAPLDRFATNVDGAGDLFVAAGADVVVIADPARNTGDDTTQWFADRGATLLRRLSSFSREAVIVCAGAEHRALVEYGVRELGIPRRRILGSASEALSAAARAIVAVEQNVSPSEIALSVLGVPPRIVVAWEDGTVGGFALTRLISEPVRRRLSDRIAALWPVGSYALAAAAGRVVASIAGRSRRLATCFVAPDDTGGLRSRTAATPVRLGPAGVVDVVMPELTVNERIALENAMLL